MICLMQLHLQLHSALTGVSGPLFDRGAWGRTHTLFQLSVPGLRVEDSREGFPLVDWLTLACLLSLSPADSPPSTTLRLCLSGWQMTAGVHLGRFGGSVGGWMVVSSPR